MCDAKDSYGIFIQEKNYTKNFRKPTKDRAAGSHSEITSLLVLRSKIKSIDMLSHNFGVITA